MKVLISPSYSSITLTRKAIDRLIQLTGDDISKYIFTATNGQEFVEDFDDSYRTNPIWLQVYDELGKEFAEDDVELVEIPDNSNFYIYHGDWEGEHVVLQSFDFNDNVIRRLLPDIENAGIILDSVLRILKDNPKLTTIKKQTIKSKTDLLYDKM